MGAANNSGLICGAREDSGGLNRGTSLGFDSSSKGQLAAPPVAPWSLQPTSPYQVQETCQSCERKVPCKHKPYAPHPNFVPASSPIFCPNPKRALVSYSAPFALVARPSRAFVAKEGELCTKSTLYPAWHARAASGNPHSLFASFPFIFPLVEIPFSI